MTLELLIFIGGILHFGILLASAAVPQVLDWKGSLAKLDGLTRQLVWVHGIFIVLVIIGFGFWIVPVRVCPGRLGLSTDRTGRKARRGILVGRQRRNGTGPGTGLADLARRGVDGHVLLTSW
jgi:hypothetical protein